MTPPLVFLTPHTHWDREWYEPAGRFRQRLVMLMDHALDELESGRLPVFLLDGQTVLVRDYLDVRPEAAARVRRLVEAGRLLVGPWYILADELLPAAETLVRNLLAGRADGRRLGGWLPLGYSPDAFGHPASLPTVLAGFGIRHALVWRGYGGEPGEQHDVLSWMGPDGARVLAHHLSPAGYELGANLPREPARLRRRWREIRAELEPRAGERPWLVLCGADHHRPPANIRDVATALGPITGRPVTVASPLEYFRALPEQPRVPQVEGELRFSYRYALTLQGTHAVRSRLKQAIREAERLLVRWAEPQAALARVAGGPARWPLLDAAWRLHLLNCFHDTLAGTVSDVVARAAAARADEVIAQARGILDDALHDRLGQDRSRARRAPGRWHPTLVIVNPSAYDRSGVVEATVVADEGRVVVGRPHDVERPGAPPSVPVVTLPDGAPVPMQVLESYDAYDRLDAPDAYPRQDRVRAWRVALWVNGVPALGLKALPVVRAGRRRGAAPPQRVRARGATLESDGWRVRARGAQGFVLEDRERRLAIAGAGAVVSESDGGDAYTFDPAPRDPPRVARWSEGARVRRGPLVAVVARRFVIPGRTSGTVYARLDAGAPFVRFVVVGDNHAGGHRLRIRFPLPGPLVSAWHLADMHYGPVLRLREEYDLAQFPREHPVPTAPMHRYASVPGGLTVLSRDAYEYELTDDGAIAVTLFRSIDQLSRADLAARPGHVAWPMAIPEARDLGRYRFELAIARPVAVKERGAEGLAIDAPLYVTAFETSALEPIAEAFHAPLAGRMLRYGMDVPGVVKGPRLEGEGLALTAVKPSEDRRGLVLRCVNGTDRTVRGVWILPFRVTRAMRARLDEQPSGGVRLAGARRQVAFEAAAREVVTIIVEASGRARPRRPRGRARA